MGVGSVVMAPVRIRTGSPDSSHTGHGVAAFGVAVVTALAGVVTVGFILTLPLGYDGEDVEGRLAAAAFVVGMVGLASVGAVLARRGTAPRMAWLLLFTGLTGALARANVGYALAAELWSWPGAQAAAWLTNWTWVPAQGLAMVLVLRFPDGELAGRRSAWLERVVLGWIVLVLLVTAVYPGVLGVDALAPRTNPLGVAPLAWLLGPVLSATFAVMPVLFAGCVLVLAVRWRRAGPDVRRQVGWVAAATVVLAVAAPVALLSRNGEVLEGLAYLTLPAAIGVAVLRYRLWDLGPAVRRSVVFALASAMLASLYLGVVLLLDHVVGQRGVFATALAATVVAVVAVPARSGAQRMLDHLLYGNRRDPYAVVRDLGARLENAGPDLLSSMCDELATSLRVPYVAIELVNGRVLAEAGDPAPEGGRVPLVRSGSLLGHLVVGRRSMTEPLTDLDRHLLEDLAGHAGTAVRAALLDAELRDSYERLLLVREHERARLRRELHDGLGPVLGAVTLRAEAARNMVRAGGPAEEVDAVLAGVGAETELAVREVRRLLEDLVPSVVVEQGLRKALETFAENYTLDIDVRLDLPEALPPLAATTEVAVYRVVGEALRNASRHSGGDVCTVTVTVEGADLTVEVSDDGRGMADASPGVGIKAMRERVAAVGGHLQIIEHPDSGSGITIRARLPWSQE